MRASVATDGWKRSLDDYVRSACGLFESMREDGFALSSPIPVDPGGDLLGGAHRLACALALGIVNVPVMRQLKYVFAPPWDYQWFVMNGMGHDDLERLCRDWREMCGERA